MDAYLPPGAQPSAGVIVVHGGGWEAGDKRTYVSPLLDVLKRSGLAYFSIDYRLTPFVTNREQIEDLRSAIRYVRTHAQRFHIDSKRISLAGESAGGQLVTQVVSLPCPGCEVAAVVSLYGVYDFAQFTAQPSDRQMLDRIFGKWTTPALKEASPQSRQPDNASGVFDSRNKGRALPRCPGLRKGLETGRGRTRTGGSGRRTPRHGELGKPSGLAELTRASGRVATAPLTVKSGNADQTAVAA